MEEFDNKHTCKACHKIIRFDVLSATDAKKLSTYRSTKRVPKYCNRECFESLTGKDHPAYKNGTGRGYNFRERKKTLSLLPNVCFSCGAKERLIVHHIDKNPRNNDLSNLQILCKSCHRTHHWKDRKKWNSTKEAFAYYHKLRMEKKNQKIKDKILEEFGEESFLRTPDVCKKLNLSRERIRQLRNSGKFNFLKIGGSFFYPENKLKKY